jgi:peptide/nickel transport system substrate-binding protein
VGAGAFKVREWVLGSHALLEANERYILGRPRIDRLEVRFIPDHNTRMANVLAGAVDLTMGVGFSTDQGVVMRDQWLEGQVAFEFVGNWVTAAAQFVDPQPGIVADVRFRKALVHAIDRQGMADTLQFGLSPVAHSFLSPDQPQYREIEAGLVRYDYDPRKAAQMIEALGYVRGADGAFRDSTGQRLELDIRTGGTEITPKASAVVAEAWGRLGIPTSITLIPVSRRDEREYMSTYPAFRVYGPRNDLPGITNLHSSRSPLPANNFRFGGVGNASRYHNAELDRAIDRYLTTIPQGPRLAALGQIIHHVSDQLNYTGLFYTPAVEMVGNRVLGVTTGRAAAAQITWNAHEWDVRL